MKTAANAAVVLCAFILATHNASAATTGLIPLSTLGNQTYKGFTGGLYSDGQNEPSGPHAEALKKLSATIQPLDKDGKPDPKGKIVIVGIGASVCVQVFKALEEVAPTVTGISTNVVFINCAKGGHDVNKISDPERKYWESAKSTIEKAGYSIKQVQVAWYQSDELKDTRDDFPGRPQRLQASIANNMRELKLHFPNTRICYHSARHTTAFSPETGVKDKHGEPRPYQVGWAVKWLLEEQAKGSEALRFDGPDAKAPLIAWASYFWTDADQPRHDGYRWSPADVVKDGVHLSPEARPHVAKELIAFWRNDSFAKLWFTGIASTTSTPPAIDKALKPQQIAAQNLKPGEPALLINGKSKFAKLERLLATTEPVKLVAYDQSEKQVLAIEDVFRKRTELNQLLGSGKFRLHFLDKNNQRIKMTMDVPDVVTLK